MFKSPWCVRTSAILRSREFGVLGAILVLGAIFRWWGFASLGLTHYDEGAYTISAMWPWAREGALFFPKQIFFSPPLYFLVVSVAYQIAGAPSDTAAIAVNLLLSTAMIVLMWSIARQWFGIPAALAAAALFACNNYYVSLARVALTDTLFAFLFLLSLLVAGKAMGRGSIALSLLGGVVAGAALNTKYAGWMPLMVAAAAAAACSLREAPDRRKRMLQCWLVMCAIAALLYLPWALFVESHPGGYAALARYQRTFVSSHWLENLWRHIGQQWYLDGWLTRISPAIAALAVFFSRGDWLRRERLRALAVGTLLLASGLILGGTAVLFLLAIAVLPGLCRRRSLDGWILLGAVALMFLITPIYRPYARLWMPVSACLSLAAAVQIARMAMEPQGLLSRLSVPAARSVLALALVLSVAAVPLVAPRISTATWTATDTLRAAAVRIMATVSSDDVVIVHGAPELAFYLRAGGYHAAFADHPLDHPAARRDFKPGRASRYLVTGIYAVREPNFRNLVAEHAESWDYVAEFEFYPSDLRLLDDFLPDEAREFRQRAGSDYKLRLYRLDRWLAELPVSSRSDRRP